MNFSTSELQRLYNLLCYSQEAIDYWFNGCDVDESYLNENNIYKIECQYFLDKLKNMHRE
ncbi:hypothetical protein EXM30_04915 [Clostridium botulinum]|uniref:hypothetical protein n=1 Tax=Clostridium botulinum TaxID=1491 RepID=UPI0007E072EF|nr:hypothetical protein [Clostridium botulinum]KEI82839.1 hypothetical protein N487_01440 [Clostridium botulinum B2 331]NFA89731.1 hypothetical protein [Clostridium botulinum]NFB20054.1 hypothetical protein [Clostridium botulinum]NFI38456.1 hypothetical protein [Clostridium botulinum]NFT56286.1 hypothetical protein [Clostridium botulinum]